MGSESGLSLSEWSQYPNSSLCSGIKEQLNHFQYLNIKAVWISPFYKSPMKDFGYDVEDFRAIDPLFGTMEDFDDLMASMHSMGEHHETNKSLINHGNQLLEQR